MEALLVSPLRPWQIIVGKVAPYLVIGFVSVLAVIVEARLVFHVPIARQPDAAARRRPAVHSRRRCRSASSSRRGRRRSASRCCGAWSATMLPTQLLSGFIFPDREHAGGAAVDHEHRAGAVVRADRARHHAQGRRPDVPLARDARSRRDGGWCCWPRARARSRSGWTDGPCDGRSRSRAPRCCTSFATGRRCVQIVLVPIVQLSGSVECGDVRHPAVADLRRRHRSHAGIARRGESARWRRRTSGRRMGVVGRAGERRHAARRCRADADATARLRGIDRARPHGARCIST